MKKLGVPYFRQTQETDCLAACLNMALQYFGIHKDYDELCKQLHFYEIGLTLPQIGNVALENGLTTEISLLNPFLFNTKDASKTADAVREKIERASLESEQQKMVRDYFLEFMDAGGVIKPVLPTKELICREIDKNRPVLVNLASRLVHGHLEGFNFHANIVYGYDDKVFFVHDPAKPEGSGGSHEIDQDLFMYAVNVIGYTDLDNASFLAIGK